MDPAMLRRIAFQRDVWEANLLVDFVSGRNDQGLDDLEAITLPKAVKNLAGKSVLRTADPSILLRELARITRDVDADGDPPPEDIAFVSCLVDGLNDVAWPARGLTIGFNTLVALPNPGAGAARAAIASRWPALRPWLSAEAEPELRATRAERAFPQWAPRAQRLRRAHWWLIWASGLLLALLLALNANIGFYRGALDHISATRATYRTLLGGKSGPELSCQALAQKPDPDKAQACARLQTAYSDFVGAQRSLQDRLEEARHPTWATSLDFTALWVRNMPIPTPAPGEVGYSGEELAVDDVVEVLNSVALPGVLAALGAIVGVLWSHRSQIARSTLAPREYAGLWFTLILGAAAGSAVGFFVHSSGGSAFNLLGSGSRGASTAQLSAPALAFLAGFGSNYFFRSLEQLLERVFPDHLATTKRPRRRADAGGEVHDDAS